MPAHNPNSPTILVSVPLDVKKHLRFRAIEEGTSMTELASKILTEAARYNVTYHDDEQDGDQIAA